MSILYHFSRNSKSIRVAAIMAIQFLISASVFSQAVPSPKEHFGFSIGDNYSLATYTETEAYFKKLAVSDRVRLADIGKTEEGRSQYMLIISSPENIRNLEKYRQISGTLARADGLTDEKARELAGEGKAVVWIDGGLHATEVVGTHQLIETAWNLVNRNDPETMNILNNVIVLLAHANPDGQELVSGWYMKEKDPEKRRMDIPRLYQKYSGHDNNRDFYMLSMKESRNISRQLYIEWFPQILYNHHQSGPAGSVLAGPPYRDPFNYVYDPLVMTTIDALGAAMSNRLNAEGKPGYTMRGGAVFSTWYNGGLRTTSYYHNIVGLLTEIIGSPTPGEIPLVPDRLLPSGSTPYPVTPQKFYFKQAIDYSVSLNYAVMNYAARFRSELLYNIFRMGMNSIEKGSRDNWTVTPKAIDAMKSAYNNDRRAEKQENEEQGQTAGFSTSRMPVKYYDLILRDPARRDPRGYIIPSDQEDFPTAVKFVNALIGSGILVHKATKEFTVEGKNYPAGSYIVKCDQAFRPHVLDMFEPQDHPNDLQYPGGPPVPPYDAAGWTLAFQMGIGFERVLTGFDGPFERIPYGEMQSFETTAVPSSAGAGYILSPRINNSFTVVNDLLKSGVEVHRLTATGSDGLETGSFYIPATSKARNALAVSAATNGVKVTAVNKKPAGLARINPARIAVSNRYGGSMPSGWLSWIMEQFHFDYSFIYPQEIDSIDLRKKYDVIIFTSGAIPGLRSEGEQSFQGARQATNRDLPAEYRMMTGNITQEKSIPNIRKFIEQGGVVITMETSTNLAYHLSLPVKNALTRVNEKGEETRLSGNEYYIPGSLLQADILTTDPACYGMPALADVYFSQSQVFRFEENAEASGLKKLAWFSTETPLHSGWALGQKYLKDGIIAFSAPVGDGMVYAFGPNITFRSQTHGMFKMIFNQLYVKKK